MTLFKCNNRSLSRYKLSLQRLYSSKSKAVTAIALLPENMPFRQRIFTGIQPTGTMHLGNYLGVVKKWTEVQQTKDDAIFCIADMHSITTPKDPVLLRENIFRLAAALLAAGIDLNFTTLFVQSAVKEHSELSWILGTMSSMTSLGHQPMYLEKTRHSKEIPLGIFSYPVMQAADILLYKSTHAMCGEDQMSHIRFAQAQAQTFNSCFEKTFPICKAVTADHAAGRIRCLVDPSRKMSKSISDLKSTIYITDEPDEIVYKIKEATTDFSSDVRYDMDRRAGVSNLIGIHANITGKTPEEIVVESASLDTNKYKMVVADTLIEHLTPMRRKYFDLLERRNELIYQLDSGAAKARVMAVETIDEVKQKVGLGAMHTAAYPVRQEDVVKPSVLELDEERKKKRRKVQVQVHIPVVPKQQMREEKSIGYQRVSAKGKY